MAENSIPKRSEIAEEFTWNLKDMFESDEAWLREYEALKEMPARIAAFQGHLGESAETLLEFLRLEDRAAGVIDPILAAMKRKYGKRFTETPSDFSATLLFVLGIFLGGWVSYGREKVFPHVI